jgi:hypothetical protein
MSVITRLVAKIGGHGVASEADWGQILTFDIPSL